MKALLCKEHGLPETLVVDEVANPTPGKNQVELDVKAAAGFEAVQVLNGKRKISDVANEGMRGAVVAGTSTALVAYLFG